MLLAFVGTRLLVRFIASSEEPVLLDLMPDWRVLLFTMGVTAVTALLCGLVPARRAVRVDVASTLREQRACCSASRRATRPRSPRRWARWG